MHIHNFYLVFCMKMLLIADVPAERNKKGIENLYLKYFRVLAVKKILKVFGAY